MNEIDVKGRVAVVTGGGSGIGLAIVQRLDRSGAQCVAWDRDGAALADLSRHVPRVTGIIADVADPASVDRALSQTIARHGALDILVNNAGITGPNAKLWDYPAAEWRRVFAINVDGTFNCLRSVVPVMRQRRYGRIVNIASVAGKEGNPNASAYSATKAAVIAMTKSLGKELADTDIRVNCVTPAAVKTALFDQMSQQHIDYMLSKIPVGRFGLVDEIAALVAWLCSQECSFSTGAVFDLSGGRSTY